MGLGSDVWCVKLSGPRAWLRLTFVFLLPNDFPDILLTSESVGVCRHRSRSGQLRGKLLRAPVYRAARCQRMPLWKRSNERRLEVWLATELRRPLLRIHVRSSYPVSGRIDGEPHGRLARSQRRCGMPDQWWKSKFASHHPPVDETRWFC